jgi:multidrug efflux system membrane fusion protein
MKKRTLFFGVVLVLALAGIAVATRGPSSPEGAAAQATRNQGGPRAVPVETRVAQRKPIPVRIDSIGTVTPIASVAIKSRLETTIMAVHFADGARVNKGDPLFTLDSRQLEAQVQQAEGILARAKALLEGAERDLRRYGELVARNATPVTNLDNARTQADVLRAQIKADEATLENLRVQLSYTRLTAPISGRISAAAVKVGNFVRPSDATPLATINQMAPVYVAFAVPQRVLPELRQAVAANTAVVEAKVAGDIEPESGRVTMIENTVDPGTGMVTVRATMENGGENLWPGTLVNTQVTLRVEDAVAIPATAVQSGQSGTYVFVVRNGAAAVQPVTVARTVGLEAAISKGLEGGETVVTDGQLLLAEGVRVIPRQPRAGS